MEVVRTLAELRLEYFVVDVFSERRLEGNPLAIVLNPGHLSTEQMQAIARETNLSETVFVERRPTAIEIQQGVRARIFTTQEELPFAGHPTLGTACLLKNIAPDCVADNSVTLALNVGPISVRFDTSSKNYADWPVQGQMTQLDPEFGPALDPTEVAGLTGLQANDFHPGHPPQIVSTGTAFAIAVLRSADTLARLDVRQAKASAYLRPRGARWFYVLGPESSHPSASPEGALHGAPAHPRWRARMQFNGGEDPATGSAAGCAISYLVHHGLVAPGLTVHLRQGIEMHRPSDLFLKASLGSADQRQLSSSRVTRVCVAGSTVLVATGHLFLP